MKEPTTKEDLERMGSHLDLGGGVTAIGHDEALHPSEEPVHDPNPQSEKGPSVDKDIHRDYDIILDPEEQKQWSDKPSYADQFLRFPETVRKIGPTMDVFDLADPDDLHRLNMLQAGAASMSAPRSALSISDTKWDEKTSNWKILGQVIQFKYLKILEKD